LDDLQNEKADGNGYADTEANTQTGKLFELLGLFFGCP